MTQARRQAQRERAFELVALSNVSQTKGKSIKREQFVRYGDVMARGQNRYAIEAPTLRGQALLDEAIRKQREHEARGYKLPE